MKPWGVKHWATFLLLAFLLVGVGGCERRKEVKNEPGKRTGSIQASGAYVTYFGEPPTVAEGSCFALVGYYPLAAVPGKVSPFPLFMFNREQQLQVVTEQLLQWGEGWEMGGILTNPFPPGTDLLSLSVEQGMARVELSPAALADGDPVRQKLILAVLGHTLTQFDGVDRVMVVANGTLLPFQAERGFYPDPEAVVPPSAPQALSVVGVWAEKAENPEEVSVFFDRPVRVDAVRVTFGGRRLEGDYYQSVFDMAVVVRPQQPEQLSEGQSVGVGWKVEDRLGRKGEGEKTFILRRVEHP